MNTYSMRKSAAMVLALSLLHVSSVLAQDDNTNSKEEGSIAGAELITKDEAKGIKNQIMTGSYLRPFTIEFTASLKF